MALTYTATFSGTSFAGVSAAAAQDLFSLKAGATTPVRISWIRLSTASQTSPAELVLSLKRFATFTAGSGGTSVTPVELAQYVGVASASTVAANNTTRSASTATVIWAETVQVLNGWEWLPTPELHLHLDPAQGFVLGLEVAPGSATTLYGSMAWIENT